MLKCTTLKKSYSRLSNPLVSSRINTTEGYDIEDLTEWRATTCDGPYNKAYWEMGSSLIFEIANLGVQILVVSNNCTLITHHS